jgi:hypothetical protein
MEEKEELGDSTDGPDVRGACLLELIWIKSASKFALSIIYHIRPNIRQPEFSEIIGGRVVSQHFDKSWSRIK